MLCRSQRQPGGSSLLFSKRHLVTPHPNPISFINSGSPSELGFQNDSLLVQLWADAVGSPAAEMPLCGAGMGKERLCPFLPGETARGHGGGMERGQELCHQPAAQQVFPLFFPGISLFSQSSPFLWLFEDEGLLLLSGFCFICSHSLLLFGGFGNDCLTSAI